MQNTITQEIQEVAKFYHKKPGEIIAEAVEIGIEKMWVDTILAQYLQKKISHWKAVQLVGGELVKFAQQQNKVVQQDVKWGIKNAAHRC